MDKSRIQSSNRGFTLMEMLAVLAVLAILLTLAIPSFANRTTRTQITESMELIKNMKESINLFYMTTKKFPRTNSEAGLPAPEFLIGNYVKRIDIVDGAFNITFGNKAHTAIADKILSIRPLVVKGSPESPISWNCGLASIPEGMIASGANQTNIDGTYLPIGCF